jgi:hypothetical protein
VTTGPPDDVVVATRLALQQVAVHVLARRRDAVTRRFGLRPAPAGLATPPFGDEGEVVRVSGTTLVVERLGETWAEPLSTLGRAADLVEVDLTADFRVGRETLPPLDPEAPLDLDRGAVLLLAGWWALGAGVIDEVLATPGETTDASPGSAPVLTRATAAQLWPEHLDHACTVTVAVAGGGGGTADVNLGASPGDDVEPQPYLYVGPTGPERPAVRGYWNAPFGAVLRRADVAALPATARREAAASFLRRGLAALAAG